LIRLPRLILRPHSILLQPMPPLVLLRHLLIQQRRMKLVEPLRLKLRILRGRVDPQRLHMKQHMRQRGLRLQLLILRRLMRQVKVQQQLMKHQRLRQLPGQLAQARLQILVSPRLRRILQLLKQATARTMLL